MDIQSPQELAIPLNDLERRIPDQFNRLNVRTNKNDQNGGDLYNYGNANNKRKVSHEVINVQPYPQPKDSKNVDEKERKELLKPGDMIKNRWRITYKIGGGGFGEIYQAIDTQMDPEKINQSRTDASKLCSSCSIKSGVCVQRHVSTVAMPMNESNLRLQPCSGCGREFYPTSVASIERAEMQRKFSENGLESTDSGISLGNSERGLVPYNYTVAVKAECNTQAKQMLHMEVAVMRRLKGRKNFCELLTCGKTQRINYIVMTLQGKNLSELRKKAPKRAFSRSTSLRIICKCMDALEELHSIGYLHRDIKPSNFCLRRDNPMEICLLDFGLVRPYTKPGSTSQLRPPRPTAGFRGTVRYASINAHDYHELGRHDDLWSMYYMLLEFLSGELPWQRRSGKDKVRQMKVETEPVSLGTRSGLPQNIATTWVHELNSLDYYATPNYRELRKVIETWLSENRVEWNDPYDWQKQVLPRAESESTFTPLFKRNQTTGRQFVQNVKRPPHHDSAGCLRRMDKRGFGSNAELKRFDSDGGEGGTTAFARRSTTAAYEDATANKNMATEKIMQEDVHGNLEDSSEKMDGKEKLMGSHVDLHATGDEQQKPTENADRQILGTSKSQDSEEQSADAKPLQKLLSLLTFGRKKSDTPPAVTMTIPRRIRPPERPALPPPPPPHRTPDRDDAQFCRRPENRPLLPPPVPSRPLSFYSRHPQMFTSFPSHNYRYPTVANYYTPTLPTPKPRSNYAICGEKGQEKQGSDDLRGRWPCQTDIRRVVGPTSAALPYTQKSIPIGGPRYPLGTSEPAKGRCTSREHLGGSPTLAIPQVETGAPQHYRSMTALNYGSAEGCPTYGRPTVVSAPIAQDSGSPIEDGRIRSLSAKLFEPSHRLTEIWTIRGNDSE